MASCKKKLQVLFLAEELRTGGAETYFYRLEEMLDRDRVDFFTMAVCRQKCTLSHPEFFTPYGFLPISRIKAVSKFVRNHPVDIVHANSLQLCGIAALIRRTHRHAKFKIVYTKHNVTKLENISPAMLRCFVNNFVDCIIAICKTDEICLEKLGITKRLITNINNSVDLSNYPFTQRFPLNRYHKLKVGILARLSPEKRHDLFLEIAKGFCKRHENSVFYIAGDGPLFDEIARTIKNERLENNVRMLGRVSAPAFLNQIDALLLVSNREVMPMSLLEGMASGCAIIARSVGGVGDIVKRDTGILIEGDDSQDYIDALDLLYSETVFSTLTRNARDLIEDRYSLEIALDNHMKLYRHLSVCGDGKC